MTLTKKLSKYIEKQVMLMAMHIQITGWDSVLKVRKNMVEQRNKII